MSSNLNEKPDWFDANLISESMDARAMLKAGGHPLDEATRIASGLSNGQIFELITPFAPMPLIEKIMNNGFAAYMETVSGSEIHSYFCKK